MKIAGCFLVLSLYVLNVSSSHIHRHGDKPHEPHSQRMAQRHRKESSRLGQAENVEESVDMNQQVVQSHKKMLQARHQEMLANLRGHQVDGDAKASPTGTSLSALTDAAAKRNAVESEEESAFQPPISAKLTKDELKDFLGKLSPDCEKQFQAMLEGHGRAKGLHHFGSAGRNTTTASECGDLGGALCKNHARILQTSVVPDGRKMVANSEVDGKSCLPQKCIQDADLRLLAGMLQQKAVETLGPASHGQQPVEVLLDVDCTSAGGSSYSATSEWSMERAGPTRSASFRSAISIFGVAAALAVQICAEG